MKKVLIVEDECFTRLSLELIMRQIGYSVSSAKDGVEGLEAVKAAQENFDIVISDINMPRLNGAEMIKIMLEEKLCEQTKYVVITGNLDSKEVKSLLDIGFEKKEICPKPFDVQELKQYMELAPTSQELKERMYSAL